MLIDISVPLTHGMLRWPGDPEVEVRQVASIDQGSLYNLTHLNHSVHSGTHMDAPRHFIRDGLTMGAMPLEATIGPCRVIEIDDPAAIRRGELEAHAPQAGERLIFKTRNSRRHWPDHPFDENFVYITDEGARYLVECGVRTVGIDYLSVGGFHHDTAETHWTLLGAGIWVIEGLYLGHVEPGAYELLCLPLKLVAAEGAPCRACLRHLA
jgi:arylformamidase